MPTVWYRNSSRHPGESRYRNHTSLIEPRPPSSPISGEVAAKRPEGDAAVFGMGQLPSNKTRALGSSQGKLRSVLPWVDDSVRLAIWRG
jgi:hypothetical protein